MFNILRKNAKSISVAIFIVLASAAFLTGQGLRGSHGFAHIITTYSQNGDFYLKSIPYDKDFPSLRGKTFVYKNGIEEPLYVIQRKFDSAFIFSRDNHLVLSNNGEMIFFIDGYSANDEQEELKSVTIYKNGKLFKSFTESEITGCDKTKERCSLIYSNFDKVVDREKSGLGTLDYKKIFKDGVDEIEKFLSDFSIFCSDDKLYLTDSKKRVHMFDLKEGNLIQSDSFENIFDQVKDKGRFNKCEIRKIDLPFFVKFPKLQNGKDAYESLAKLLDMKAFNWSADDQEFKWYRFDINVNIFHDGSLEIEKIEIDDNLPKEKIIEFFTSNKFDGGHVSTEIEKWNIGENAFLFRKKDDKLARQEKQQEIEEYKKQLVADKINDIYIPKNLQESFIELDKLLAKVDKNEMQTLSKHEDMIRYHMGLGMWLRNNWGLWGGSRLQEYFTSKGIYHPDDMSGIILDCYYYWLNGNKKIWEEWEKNPKNRY